MTIYFETQHYNEKDRFKIKLIKGIMINFHAIKSCYNLIGVSLLFSNISLE